jgi:hypothetical protein
MMANAGIQPYMKIRSPSCGYADLMGAVFNDAALTGVQLYGFYDGTSGLGYVIDAAMTGPDQCKAYCDANPTCQQYYYQYEYTDSSRLGTVTPAWFHKCQLTLAFSGTGCAPVLADDANDWDEYSGRVSAAGTK